MADPVAWTLIEPGWRVVDRDGGDVGTIDEVVGDTGADIFDGLAILTGIMRRPRYVPAESVREIVEGRVTLDLDRAGADALTEYREPPSSERILPEGAGVGRRVEEALIGGERDRALRVPFLRRVWVTLLGRRRGR